MATFTIDPRNNGGDEFEIEANNYEQAATIAAAKLFPKYRISGVFANRHTGDAGKSGMFKAFYPLGNGQVSTSIGRPFHVWKEA